MAQQSEVGHAKNLANIDKLIDLITQFGIAYNPTNPQIQLSGFNTLKTLCTTDYNNWIAALTTWKADTDIREIAFEPVDKISTAISDNVKTLGVPQQTINDTAAIVSKIHGSSGKLTKADAGKIMIDPNQNPIPIDPNIPTPISTSQQSYDSIIANFDKLIQQVQAIPSYAPNEVNIQIANLQTLLASLKTVNLNAITATNALNLARNQRNLSFYAPNTGLYDITKKAKSYIRQIYGSTSSQYHQATAIKFVKIVTKKKSKKKKNA